MSQQTEIGLKTFTAGEALAVYRFVRLSNASGTSVVYADAYDDDLPLYVTQQSAASGDNVTCAIFGPYRTFKVTVGAQFSAANAAGYLANDGKLSTSAVGNEIAKNLKTASGDGAIVEVMPVYAKTTASGIGS